MTGTRLERRARTKRRHDASTKIITIFFLSLCLSFTKITITIILFDKISPRAPDGNYYKTETCRRRRARFHLRERGRRRRTIEKFIAPPISINSVRKQFSACVSSRCAPDEPNVGFFFFYSAFSKRAFFGFPLLRCRFEMSRRGGDSSVKLSESENDHDRGAAPMSSAEHESGRQQL